MILGSCFVAISAFLVEFSELNAKTSSFYRMAIGGSVLCILSIRSKWPNKNAFRFCLLAGTIISFDLIAWNQSVLYIGAGLATVLANLHVIFLILIAKLFYRETFPKNFLFFLLLALIGVIALLKPHLSYPKSLLGIFLALIGAVSYTIYLVTLKSIHRQDTNSSPLAVLAVISFIGAFFTGLLLFITEPGSFYIESKKSLSILLFNSAFVQILGWLLITKSVQNIPLSLCGTLMLAQPAATYLIDTLIFQRNTLSIQIIGAAILFFAIFAITRAQNLPKELPKSINRI